MPKLDQPYDLNVLPQAHAKMLEDHFACIGAGGAAASALLLGLLGGRIRNRETGDAAPSSTGSEKGGATVG